MFVMMMCLCSFFCSGSDVINNVWLSFKNYVNR